MAKTLYVERTFSSLHQKRPADYDLNKTTYLEVQGYQTTLSKYALEFGFGDPGEPKYSDSFDYAEFQISSVTLTKPSSFGEQGTYQSEGADGATHTSTYTKWGTITVPDDFLIPSDLYKSAYDQAINVVMGDARTAFATFIQAYDPTDLKWPSYVGQLNNGYNLYAALSTHMDTQLTLMNQAMSGQIGATEFEQRSNQAAQQLQVDLAATAGIPGIYIEALKLLGSIVRSDPQQSDAQIGGTLMGNEQNESFVGGPGPNSIADGGGNDAVSAGSGDDTVYAGAGDDFLSGGDGIDTLDFSAATSKVSISLGTGFGADGLGGRDWVLGFENLVGGSSSDQLFGDDRANWIMGGAGRDTLVGEGGNDRLIGGPGKDFLSGKTGRDVFAFGHKDTGSSKATADYIVDFSGARGDRLDLSAIDANSKKAGDQKFAFIGTKPFTKAGQVRYEKMASDTYVYFNTDNDKAAEGVIRLKGVFDLQKTWFVL